MLGEQIKEKREKKELTKIEVARRVGVSINAYSNWENGTSKPKEGNMKKLKEVLEGEDEKGM